MLRRFIALVCVLLASVAAPHGGIGDALDKAFGVAQCGGPDCCCAAREGGDCCAGKDTRPRLVSACRCGHHDDGTPNGAPEMPRLCSVQTTRLPDLCLAPSTSERASRVLSRRPLAPDPPPPRDQD